MLTRMSSGKVNDGRRVAVTSGERTAQSMSYSFRLGRGGPSSSSYSEDSMNRHGVPSVAMELRCGGHGHGRTTVLEVANGAESRSFGPHGCQTKLE